MSEILNVLAAGFLDFSKRKLRLLASRIETCVGGLNEEQIWARGSENEKRQPLLWLPFALCRLKKRAALDHIKLKRQLS